jgi:hypothetical protein
MERLALPDHLQGVFFDTIWQTSKVWALPTPPSTRTLEQLQWHLELTVWSTVPGEPRFDLYPAHVLASPDVSPRQWARIFKADLARPLELFQNRQRWVIVDGYHRLAMHWLRASAMIPVRLHPASLWRMVRTIPAGPVGALNSVGVSR